MSHQYLLLLHEHPADFADLSADAQREVVEGYAAWAQDLAKRGHLVGAEKLADDGGRHLRLRPGQAQPVATDGPYAEAHDVVGGFFVLRADNDAQAEALAASCPHLSGSSWVELRRIEPT